MHDTILHREAVAAAAVATLGLCLIAGRALFAGAPAPPEARPIFIDPNTASVEVLTILPGVGRATAFRILAGRPYEDVPDLGRVLSAKQLRRIAPYLRVR
jgi:DNA uptake protein ComE-like DNA-binding protein